MNAGTMRPALTGARSCTTLIGTSTSQSDRLNGPRSDDRAAKYSLVSRSPEVDAGPGMHRVDPGTDRDARVAGAVVAA
jgi:hypothetical protein